MRLRPRTVSVLKWWVTLGAALFLFTGQAVQPAIGVEQTSLVIRVVNQRGEAVNGTAWVEGSDGGERVGPLTFTGGEFFFPELPDGIYRLYLEASGYRALDVEVLLPPTEGVLEYTYIMEEEEGSAPEERAERAEAESLGPALTEEEEKPPHQGGKAVLKVVTYNIHHGEGIDGRVDLERIAAALEELNADVIVLNEVDAWWPRSGHVDQASWLADRLEMPYYFYGPNLQGRGNPSAPGPPAYGNLLLSRFPLLGAENRPLPRAGLSEPRGVIVAEVDVEGEPLTVLGTHLGLSPQERYLQAAALRQLTVERLTDRRVLLGDLNADAAQPEIALLLGDPFDPQAWVDVASRSPEPPLTFPAWAPRVRIDYILLSPALAERVQEVRSVESEASDHLPLLAVLN